MKTIQLRLPWSRDYNSVSYFYTENYNELLITRLTDTLRSVYIDDILNNEKIRGSQWNKNCHTRYIISPIPNSEIVGKKSRRITTFVDDEPCSHYVITDNDLKHHKTLLDGLQDGANPVSVMFAASEKYFLPTLLIECSYNGTVKHYNTENYNDILANKNINSVSVYVIENEQKKLIETIDMQEIKKEIDDLSDMSR